MAAEDTGRMSWLPVSQGEKQCALALPIDTVVVDREGPADVADLMEPPRGDEKEFPGCLGDEEEGDGRLVRVRGERGDQDSADRRRLKEPNA